MPLSSFFTDNIVVYPNLGDSDDYGTSLDEVIETLELEPIPSISVSRSSKMLPLIMDSWNVLHPVFKEDCSFKKPFCFDYSYSPYRMSRSLFGMQPLQISIIDQNAEMNICTLYYRYDKLEPEGWEAIYDLVLSRSDIPRLIPLLRRIQYAHLSDLLE
jgi:hypothetical protein